MTKQRIDAIETIESGFREREPMASMSDYTHRCWVCECPIGPDKALCDSSDIEHVEGRVLDRAES